MGSSSGLHGRHCGDGLVSVQLSRNKLVTSYPATPSARSVFIDMRDKLIHVETLFRYAIRSLLDRQRIKRKRNAACMLRGLPAA